MRGQRPPRDEGEQVVLLQPHIIIEDSTKRHRSFWKEFPPDQHNRSSLPAINFESPAGFSPFLAPHVVQERARFHEHHRYVCVALRR